MAKHFQETYRTLSRLLAEQARAIAGFEHRSALGDGREDLIRRFLSERVGTNFGVSKAEVVDSKGGTTGELDGVIYDQSVASCLAVLGERRIVRIESVVATIEVKSQLNASSWLEESTRIRNGIGSLTRFYVPTPFLDVTLTMSEQISALEGVGTGDDRKALSEGLSATQDLRDVPAVVSAFFAYDGPDVETAKGFAETPGIDAVCVLGKYTLAKKRIGFDKMANGGEKGRTFRWGEGDDALGAFVQVIERALANVNYARAFVLPAAVYYQPTPSRPPGA